MWWPHHLAFLPVSGQAEVNSKCLRGRGNTGQRGSKRSVGTAGQSTRTSPSSGSRSGLSQTSSSALEKREPTVGGFPPPPQRKLPSCGLRPCSAGSTHDLRVTEQGFTDRLKGTGENNRKWKTTQVPGLRSPAALSVNCQTR